MSGQPGKRKPDRGPWASETQPSREYYKCPVNLCNLEKIRGDEIKQHFIDTSNLVALDQANEHQSTLKKKFRASDSVAVPDEYLKSLLISDSEKAHTLYLFQNGFSSMKLPNCDAVGFKCQQKKNKNPITNFFGLVGPPGKAIRLTADNTANQTPNRCMYSLCKNL